MPQATEDNRRLIVELVTCFGQGDLEGLTRLLHEDFVSHNPGVRNRPGAGRQAFIDHLRSPAAQVLFTGKLDVQQMIADAEHVAVHSRLSPAEGPELMIVDIFRVDQGRVAEHWDVIQQVP